MQRYLQSMQDAGFIIKNENGYYHLLKENRDGAMLYDLLHFTREEAYVLGKAIYSVDANNIIKTNLLKKLYALHDFEKAAEAFVNPQCGENVHRILEAIDQKRRVVLKNYHSAHGNSIMDREVEAFEFTTDFISVWCFEIKSGENKLFKTARIREVEILPDAWQNESKHLKGFIDVFRISSFEKLPVKLNLSLRAYNLLIEEYPQSGNFIRKNETVGYVFDGWVCNWEGIARFCMGLPGEVEVIEPKALMKFILQKNKNVEKQQHDRS